LGGGPHVVEKLKRAARDWKRTGEDRKHEGGTKRVTKMEELTLKPKKKSSPENFWV